MLIWKKKGPEMKLSNVQTHKDEDKDKQQFSEHSHWENTPTPHPKARKKSPHSVFFIQ